jgi:transposase
LGSLDELLDGFWIHRALQNEGIESHVVDAPSIATSWRRRGVKTDRIDGETLVRALLAYQRREPRVCAMVKAPTPGEEDRRHLRRERKEITAERVQHVNRIKGFLFSQGISGYQPLRRDRRQRLDELQTGDGRALPQYLKALIKRELDRLELLLRQIKTVEATRDALLAVEQTAKLAPASNIRGIGHKRHRTRIHRHTLVGGAIPTIRKPTADRSVCRSGPDTLAERARSIENRECPKPATRDCEQH